MFKKLLAALKASGVALDEGQTTNLESFVKTNTPYKSFNTEEEYNEYLGKQKDEWKVSEDAKAAKQAKMTELLSKHKIDAKHAAKFAKLYDLDSVEAEKLEEAITAGKKESPEWLMSPGGNPSVPQPKGDEDKTPAPNPGDKPVPQIIV